MKQYLELLQDILDNGVDKDDRTNTGVLSVFGRQLRFDLNEGFPLLTTKKVHMKSIIHELLWFLKGSININYLNENKVSIWDEWADEKGDLGPSYGKQWRKWEGYEHINGKYYMYHIDQIEKLIKGLKTNPNSRRHIVSAWNVADLDKMKLPPCHILFQFYVNVEKGELSCQMYQRSVDCFLGLPFNIGSYALLTYIMADICGLKPGDLVMILGDTHIYSNHIDQCKKQLERIPREFPKLKIVNHHKNPEEYIYTDFELEGYMPYSGIKAPMAV